MKALVAELKAARVADGLVAAIAKTGAELARHFPPRERDRDELPNELLIL